MTTHRTAYSAQSRRLAWLTGTALALTLSLPTAWAQDEAEDEAVETADIDATETPEGEAAEGAQLADTVAPEMAVAPTTAEVALPEAPIAAPARRERRDDEGLARSLLAQAREISETEPTHAPSTGGSFSIFLLGAGLVVLAGWVLVKRHKSSGRADGQLLKAVQTLRIGPKQVVSVLDIGGRQLVVAMTDQAIQVLAELGPAAGAAAGLTTAPPEPAARWGAAKLDALTASRTPGDAPMNGGQDFSRLFEELRRARKGQRTAEPAVRLAATGTTESSATSPESREHEIIRARLDALRRDAQAR